MTNDIKQLSAEVANQIAAGEVVEGSEDTVKQVTYMLAMQRQWDEGGLGLVWRVAEVSMTDGQLYL